MLLALYPLLGFAQEPENDQEQRITALEEQSETLDKLVKGLSKFKASAYIQVNGFQQLDCHEDVDFIRRLEKADAQIVWSNQLRVTTSSRLSSKIAAGFAHFLQKLELKQAAEKPISLCK